MINILTLSLLVSSLAAAGVWSPSPSPSTHEPRRVIIVEYSPPPSPTHNLPPEPDNPTPTNSAKDKISDIFAKGKEKISDGGHFVEQEKGKITDKAAHLKHKAQDKFEEQKGIISNKASHLKEEVKKAVENTAEKFEEEKEIISNKASHLKQEGKNVVENTVEGVEDVVGNLSDVIRRAKDVAGSAAKYVVSKEVGKSALALAHLLGFTVAYGTGVWVTFVSSYVLATALPRQQFGVVQSRMYPVYFRVVAYGVGVAALVQWFGKGKVGGGERVQGYNLLGVLGLVILNMVYLEPKATKVMFERMKMEKEEGRGRDMADIITEPVVTASTATTTTTTPVNIQSTTTTFGVAARTAAKTDQEAIKSRVVKLSKRLKKLNTYSSFLNLLSLMGLTWHLVHLAGQMQVAC